MQEKRTDERAIEGLRSGYKMLALGLSFGLIGIGSIITAAALGNREEGLAVLFGVTSLLWFGAMILTLIGLTIVEPNQARVVILFGDYKGTIRRYGFFWVNPFSIRRKVSLRVRNFNSETLKVNDLSGNPIDIGAVVVWKVEQTAQAVFDVEDFEDYVEVQTESAIRHLAARHPYDSGEGDETSLRGSADIVNQELQQELVERLSLGGIEVLEVRLSHLAYAPEIAGAMLQRQQAEAIIQARRRIVDGAVGMVDMALTHLRENKVVELDEQQKALMVGNLLVVLCSDRGAQPIVPMG